MRNNIILPTGKAIVPSYRPHEVTRATGMIKRFERSEIILHWVNAVPFLILFLTGALNIVSRFEISAVPYIGAIRMIHKMTSVLWIVGIVYAFCFVGRDLNIANTRDQFKMGLADLTWMIKAVRSMFNRHIEVPPVGKFNIGQKMNAVLVILYAVAFAGSGTLIWAYNTMLFPWYVHAAVFFMTVLSLGGHLYLSFVHPSTRPGLIGILNGMVPRSYMIHHHGLMIENAVHRHRERTAKRILPKTERQTQERERTRVPDVHLVHRTRGHQDVPYHHIERIFADRSPSADVHADPDARLVAAWYGDPGCSDDESDVQKAWGQFGSIQLSQRQN